MVVGGGDQPPFTSAGGSSSSLEAIDATVELRVGEDGLDQFVAFGVQRGADVGREDAAYEGVASAVPARAGVFAFAGVGRDEHGDVVERELVDLDLVPVAGVGDDNLSGSVDSGSMQFAFGGGDHRL
jgi:hypothetical protein